MKTLPKIIEPEILKAVYNKSTDSYSVSVFDASYEDSEIESIEISRDDLVEYVINNELNRYEFINSKFVNAECDGLDEGFLDPYDYLDENKISVIVSYLQEA